MKRSQFLIFLSFVITTEVSGTVVNRCSEKEILPSVLFYPSITNAPCTQSPCEVKPGSEAYIAINFTSPGYLEHIRPQVRATALNFTITYDIGQDDACEGLKNTVCPLVENEFIQYGVGLKLKNWFPKVSVALEFSILDTDMDSKVICFRFDISVV